MRVTLRPETESDDAFVRRLIFETVAEELGAAAWPEPMRSQLLAVQCTGRRHRPSGFGKIIGVDGGDAGWVVVTALAHEVFLMEIMVLPELRGRGIGTAVISGILAEASVSGKPVRLNVNVTNQGAIRLYQRLGFTKIGGDAAQQLMSA
jgi:ribosomal protein S18 acetylase RimI-like enzyme